MRSLIAIVHNEDRFHEWGVEMVAGDTQFRDVTLRCGPCVPDGVDILDRRNEKLKLRTKPVTGPIESRIDEQESQSPYWIETVAGYMPGIGMLDKASPEPPG